jgi:hypothetical protein
MVKPSTKHVTSAFTDQKRSFTSAPQGVPEDGRRFAPEKPFLRISVQLLSLTLHFSFGMNALYPGTHMFRQKFTPHEDALLRAIVAEKGTADWSLIAEMMPQRDSRQCRERWLHYLSPNLMRYPWTKVEDAMLEAKVMEHEDKWKLFEHFFPGRVDMMIKNRFNLLFRRRQRDIRFAIQSLMTVQPAANVEEFRDSSESCTFQEPWDEFGQEDFEWTSIE